MIKASTKQTNWNPKVGDILTGLDRGPITRGTLALFSGASNDHALLHIDTDYVRSAGIPDVFAHGMLTMAYLGHLLTLAVRQEDIREWNVRFVAITPVHATIHCSGEVIALADEEGERRAMLRLEGRTGDGVLVIRGDASIVLHTPAFGELE